MESKNPLNLKEPFKPLRKLWHLFGGIIPLIYLFILRERGTVLFFLAPILLGFLLFDILRLKNAELNERIFNYLSTIILEKDRNQLSGSTYFLLSSFITILLFKREIAVVAILFMSLGDTVAAIIGNRFGKTAIFGKTLEGSLGCFIFCFFVSLFFFDIWVSLGGALTASLIEILPLRLDDNLLIPPVSGAVLTLLTKL